MIFTCTGPGCTRTLEVAAGSYPQTVGRLIAHGWVEVPLKGYLCGLCKIKKCST